MTEIALQQHRFDWRLPVAAVILALVLFIPLVLWSADFGPMFYLFLLTPFVSLILLIAIFVSRHQKLAVFSMLVLYCALSWILFRNALNIRSELRWITASSQYRAKISVLPEPANGELRHIEWDGWGWASNDTEVYLVYDPNDVLANEAKAHPEGKFSGIPCPVFGVHRLERHWFTVTTYTDTSWNDCGNTR